MLTKIRRIINEVKRGVGNLIYFLPVIWKFRDWDFGYSYDVFNHALKRLQGGLAESEIRDNMEEVWQIENVLTFYLFYKEALTDKEADKWWEAYHNTLMRLAPRWWD